MKRSKTNVFVSFCLHILGFLLCILPPAICTLNYFPIWREVGYESCIAGGVALLLALCAIPLYKLIADRLKSFSSYLMWLVLFLLFLLRLRNFLRGCLRLLRLAATSLVDPALLLPRCRCTGREMCNPSFPAECLVAEKIWWITTGAWLQ